MYITIPTIILELHLHDIADLIRLATKAGANCNHEPLETMLKLKNNEI